MAHILIVSQVFWPDSTAVSQHMTDLAEALAAKGNRVEVLTSRFNYEDPSISFPRFEFVKGITIRRLPQTRFKKQSRPGRLFNFLTFNLSLFFRLLFTRKKHDLIIGTTSPPLMSFIGLKLARMKKIGYCFWAMDLQPELSIVAGYLKKEGLAARFLQKLGDYVYRRADLIVALDRYMKDYMVSRGGSIEKIRVISAWPAMNTVYSGTRLENPFRRQQNFGEKIIVMYSGNLSVMHPLDTLLEASRILRSDPGFLFVFIGGGIRKKEVEDFKSSHNLENIVLLPYQKRETIHLSLAAADLQVVVHGRGCTGYTHPNKIYGAMFIGKQVLYIGPKPSHISDILEQCPGNIMVDHDEVTRLVDELQRFAQVKPEDWQEVGRRNMAFAQNHFNPQNLIQTMIAEIEQAVTLK